MDSLPPVEYEPEIRDIGLMDNYHRKGTIRTVFETLKKTGGSPQLNAHSCQHHGNGRRGFGRGTSAGGRGGNRNNAAAEDERNLDLVTWWRCRATGTAKQLNSATGAVVAGMTAASALALT